MAIERRWMKSVLKVTRKPPPKMPWQTREIITVRTAFAPRAGTASA